MNPEPEEDLEHRLQQLDAEINGKSPAPEKSSSSSWLNINANFQKGKLWFNNLSGTNKLIVSGVAIVLGIAIAQMVTKLVVSAISLALLVGLVYLGYKFFVSSNFQNKQ